MRRSAKASTETGPGFLASQHASRQRNGNGVGEVPPDAPLDAQEMLRALQAMRVGDFSVRLPHDWVGLPGKIADADFFDERWRLKVSDERSAIRPI